MAAGVNYNNVWAGLGSPIDVIAARNKGGEPEDFHIGGSDASGIVWAIGESVTNVKVGDEVVVHCGSWDVTRRRCSPAKIRCSPRATGSGATKRTGAPSPSSRRSRRHQCMPKAPHLTWEEAAAPTLVGATAYRMLNSWAPHNVREGDVVLIWGGAGGLGSMAIQITITSRRQADRGRLEPGEVRLLSQARRGRLRQPQGIRPLGPPPGLGGRGRMKNVHDRRARLRQGHLGHPRRAQEPAHRLRAPRRRHRADVGLRGCNRRHGRHLRRARRATTPMSTCATSGCARSGSRARTSQTTPRPTPSTTSSWRARSTPVYRARSPSIETGECHQLMYENRHPDGNMAILVGAKAPGMKTVD